MTGERLTRDLGANVLTYAPMAPEERPRDETGDGTTLTFETSEHDEWMMPRAITVRDRDGRWCVYVPISLDGAPARTYGFRSKS